MKKNLFAIITMAISIGVLVYFLITTDGITAFAEIAGSIQIPWFISILLLSLSVGYWKPCVALFLQKSISSMEILALTHYRNDRSFV